MPDSRHHAVAVAAQGATITGAVIRAMRAGGRPVSQQELAAHVGIPQPMISMLERERMGAVEYRLASRILSALVEIRIGAPE